MGLDPKFLRSTTLQLGGLYLGLFALSVTVLLGYIYWNTALLLGRQTDQTVQVEVQGLGERYGREGLQELTSSINQRHLAGDGSIYLLIDPRGNRIIGNLAPEAVKLGEPDGFFEFPYTIIKNDLPVIHTARAYRATLIDGSVLVVGRDVEGLRQFASLIRSALIWALAFAAALGLVGGIYISRNFLHRIELITATSHAIMAGDLSERMPISVAGDELDDLAASLNQMLDQIERLMHAMAEVSSNVAHDLRSPLTRLKARAEAALRQDDPAYLKSALENTIEDADGLIATFNALLSIARVESGQLRETLQHLDARPVLESVSELYAPLAEDEGGTFTTRFDEQLPVQADSQLLAQIVSNLLDNAFKYGRLEGVPPSIALEGRINGHEVIISVTDRGPGIAPEDRARATERFVRLDMSRSRPGNGLGLSLVASVMTLLGGRLEFDDAGPGLVVRLILNRVAEHTSRAPRTGHPARALA